MMPSPQDQVAELQAQIAALRTQLGLGPSDDISASITELQKTLAALKKQVDDAQAAEDKAAMEAAAAAAAALHDALGSTPLGNLDRSSNAGGALLATTGLTINTHERTCGANQRR